MKRIAFMAAALLVWGCSNTPATGVDCTKMPNDPACAGTSSSSGGSSGSAGIGCTPGTYDLDGNASNGCEVTCYADGGCNGPGGPLDLSQPPPVMHGSSYSNLGSFSSSAALSAQMSGSKYKMVGIAAGPSAGDTRMAGASHASRGGFLSP